MEINMDTLKIVQNKDWFDYITQALVTLGTVGSAIGTWIAAKRINDLGKEGIEGEFTFETKEKPYRVIFGLRNVGKKSINFDPKQGVYIKWENGNHKINLIDDGKDSSIQPQGSLQLRYPIELDEFEKSVINSGKIKVFIHTAKNNKFQLNPTIRIQLKEWGITKEQYKEGVKDI